MVGVPEWLPEWLPEWQVSVSIFFRSRNWSIVVPMGTLVERLRARGFLIRTFDSVAAFAESLPIPVNDKIIEGRLFATRSVGQAEVFVIEYRHREYSATDDQPVRRLVYMRHPALTGTANVSPTLFRTVFMKCGWLGKAVLLLVLGMLAIPLLLLFLLSLLLGKGPLVRVKFGGAFDRQFKVISRNEASARTLLGEPLREALLASDLEDSLAFDDGLTVVAVGEENTLSLIDQLSGLVGVALPAQPYR